MGQGPSLHDLLDGNDASLSELKLETMDMQIQTHIDAGPHSRPGTQWLRRVMTAGFAFFLVKGLLWIALAVWAVA